ncbi:MAG: PRC-barrel domain containing protein, partial [Rubrobacter sp.]|nr:PRC-barrel domain containing protein [Rubrobacter sp.]
MLNGAKDFDRYSVRAADDAVGGVDDLYFDDESWTVRYVVVGAGGSILSRRTLLA